MAMRTTLVSQIDDLVAYGLDIAKNNSLPIVGDVMKSRLAMRRQERKDHKTALGQASHREKRALV
jgi:hypothetical protein